MGKAETMEDVVGQEVEALKDLLEAEQKDHQVITMNHGKFSPAINNIIWRIITGKRTHQVSFANLRYYEGNTIQIRTVEFSQKL